MKKYIFTERQIKMLVDNLISEQKNPPIKTQKPPVTDFQGTIKGNTLTIETETNYIYITQLVDSKGIQGSVWGEVDGKNVNLVHPKTITLKIA